MLSTKRSTEAGTINAPHIAETLRCQISRNEDDQRLLEINSGTGQHLAYLAPLFPNVTFQPSEYDRVNFPSIRAYAADCPTKNLRDPLNINVCEDMATWPEAPCFESYDYMLNINMLHIEPWQCAVGLFNAAQKFLKLRGKLFTYGPYVENRELAPESIVAFDESLHKRNPKWGIRDIKDLEKLADSCGLKLTKKVNMPSSTVTLTWTRIK